MTGRAGSSRSRTGGVLLEAVLSLTLFVGVAAVALMTARNVLSVLERAGREQQAVDLARARMAELEAGIISLADLRDDDLEAVGSVDGLSDRAGADRPGAGAWRLEVQTQRTEFAGLTLVELTAIHDAAPALARLGGDTPGEVRFTLRQLVRLREEDGEAYELDPIMEGLPEAGP